MRGRAELQHSRGSRSKLKCDCKGAQDPTLGSASLTPSPCRRLRGSAAVFRAWNADDRGASLALFLQSAFSYRMPAGRSPLSGRLEAHRRQSLSQLAYGHPRRRHSGTPLLLRLIRRKNHSNVAGAGYPYEVHRPMPRPVGGCGMINTLWTRRGPVRLRGCLRGPNRV